MTKIYLCDVNPSMIEAWHSVFDREFDLDVTIIQGSIFEYHMDALVSPANSYGFMDGGLDLLISRYFGWGVQEELQQRIQHKHGGELLVGLAEAIPTNNPQIPFVISAPTMRVPMILGDKTINPYLATKATLLEIKKYPEIQSVIFPGLGTGVGQVPYSLCAYQMKEAIKDVLKPTFPQTWRIAQYNHLSLTEEEYRDLQLKT